MGESASSELSDLLGLLRRNARGRWARRVDRVRARRARARARRDRPRAGTWQEVGGGGAVAAVQLARLAGACLFLTALGDDSLGHRAYRELDALGVRVVASWRSEPQRRAFVHVDAGAERTITVIGKRVGPRRDDPLPWKELDGADAVYLTAGDAGAVRAARRARKLVSTVRAIEPLSQASVPLDALVSSARDEGESATPPESSSHRLRSSCARRRLRR